MNTPPQNVALHLLMWVSIVTAIIAAIVSASIDPERTSFLSGSYVDDSALAAKSAAAALSNVALVSAVVSLVGLLVIGGTQGLMAQMLEQVRSSGGGEGGATEGAVGDAGVDLGRGDGGVPEQPLHRE